jgi:alkylation response protein AidB-like acyl-CoA dehydrogenase
MTDRLQLDFNEVFFTDVRVPRENLVGELNGGWRISMGSLAHERGLLWIRQATGLERMLASFVELADHEGPTGRLRDDPVYRDTLARHYVDVQALRFMGHRGLAKTARAQESPEHSLLKLFGGELEQRIALSAYELSGAPALETSPEVDFRRRGVVAVEDPSSWALQYLASFDLTIGGGTSEIQRNIIAQRVLHLPRT